MEKTGSLLVSKILCVFLCLTFVFSAYAQDSATKEKEEKRVIKGRVLDENREPMIGVLVLIKGTTHGVTTGVDGDYVLEFTEKEPTLEFSFLGYEPRDFKLTPAQKVLNVNMKPSRIRVKEVVVVGFGTQAREKVTSSITKLPAEALKNVPYANVATALQGNVSGVQVQSTSGQPGAGSANHCSRRNLY